MRGIIATYSLTLLSFVQAGPTLSAQTFSEGLQIYPGRGMDGTTFISRCLQTSGGNDVTGFVKYSKDFFEGFGDVSTLGTVTTNMPSVVLRFQDQDDRTAHNYDMVIRTADAAGAPDLTNQGLWAQFANIPSPTPPAPQGTAVQWTIELQFLDAAGAPSPLPMPQQQSFFFGLTLKSNSNWPASDGLSFYEAQYQPGAFNQTVGDKPRSGATNLTWQVVGAIATNKFNVAPFNSAGIVLNYNLIASSPVLQVGAAHTKSNHSSSQGYGAAGLFPDLSAAQPDGTSFRIAHTTSHSSGDIFGLYIALNTGSSLGIPPLHLGGISGNLYLGPFALTFLTGGSMSTSSQDSEVVAAKPGTVPASAKGVQVYFQGFVTTGNQTALTNLAAVKY